jgi:hypothetical protein
VDAAPDGRSEHDEKLAHEHECGGHGERDLERRAHADGLEAHEEGRVVRDEREVARGTQGVVQDDWFVGRDRLECSQAQIEHFRLSRSVYHF